MQQLEMLEALEKSKRLFCNICKETKPEECFSFSVSTGKRGRSYKCKECDKAKCKAFYFKNREHILEKARKTYRNSIKPQAKAKVRLAMEKGLLTKQPCEICGAAESEGHHDDYAKPLEVRWLCRSHHKQWHSKHGEALNACTVRHWTPPKEAHK